ncbi:unnamed protein product [Echinostoma caproni]|uniref:Innexin n=1 Tax=Echinostoma caproni TaxID=27848 RepID=A0A183A5M9_9TREM|nr:unnamed protein product [Echinostoma caproni]
MDTHFFAGLTKFKLDAGKFRRDDDFSDRFSHTFTTLLLVIFTLVISARQYIGKPIACWVPTEFTRAQEEYAESVCWVTSTYFIPTNDVSVPVKIADREDRKIHYYQWVPFILMLQAFLFNLPCIIWRLFNWQSGIHVSLFTLIAVYRFYLETLLTAVGRMSLNEKRRGAAAIEYSFPSKKSA